MQHKASQGSDTSTVPSEFFCGFAHEDGARRVRSDGHGEEAHPEGTSVDPIAKVNDPITNMANRLQMKASLEASHKSYCEEEEAETSSRQEWKTRSNPRHDQAAVMMTVSSCRTGRMEDTARRIPMPLRGRSADFATDNAKHKIHEIPSGQKPLTFHSQVNSRTTQPCRNHRVEKESIVSRAREDADGQVGSCGKATCGDERLERRGCLKQPG